MDTERGTREKRSEAKEEEEKEKEKEDGERGGDQKGTMDRTRRCATGFLCEFVW